MRHTQNPLLMAFGIAVVIVARPVKADEREWELRGGASAEGVFVRWPTAPVNNPLTLIPAAGFALHLTFGLTNTWHVGLAVRGTWTQGQSFSDIDMGDGRSSNVSYGLWAVGAETLVRYRFNVGRIAPFLEARIGYRYTTFYGVDARIGVDSTAQPNTPSSHGFLLTFAPGVEFRIGDRIALDLALGFRFDSGNIAAWTMFLDGLVGFVF